MGKPKAKSARKPAARKLAAGTVRAVEATLASGTVQAQLAAIDAALATGGQPERTAEALLAAIDKGSPVARAYLRLRASDGAEPSEDANVVVKFCVTLASGRKLARPAFLAAWKRASDIVAVEAGWKNVARIAIDDPELLAAGVAAAHRLGDQAALADRRARLERALRLQPLLADLAGSAPARARGTRQLAALSADDRWHVYGRVLDAPARYDRALAVTAVQTLVDDPRAPDMALAAGVFEMRAHGADELVASWKPRVAANDAVLITRLLALFEWTGLWAIDTDAFEPYIAALYPVGRQRDVYAQIEAGLTSDKAIVREAFLARWLCRKAAYEVFSDAQADMLMRNAIAIAEGGTAERDQQAAHAVIAAGGGGHTGVRHALAEAITNLRPGKTGELRGDLYRGLAHVKHAEVTAFLIERLFVEHEAYGPIVEAFGTRLDFDTHRLVLDVLGERRRDAGAIHAATLYTDALLAHRGSPRLIGDIARMVLTWQPASPDDKRRLRYVFEQATIAALSIKQPADARAVLGRARQLDVTPYSDYQVKHRDAKTPAAFADPANAQLIAGFEQGALDKAIAIARETADAAQKSGTPFDASDEHLGLLAGCAVSRRFFEDHFAREVWFFDEVGDLHVYDGFAVALPSFQVTGTDGAGIPYYGMSAFIGGRSRIDDRLVMFDARHLRVREVLRFDNRVVVIDGERDPGDDDIAVQALGLRFADGAAARETVSRLARHPPRGLVAADPWYLEGIGAVVREYHMPLPNAGWSAEGHARIAVVGSRIEGVLESCPPLERVHGHPDLAAAAMQAWEGQIFAGGGRITKLAIDRKAIRREDTLVSAFLDARHREDSESAAWHLRGLADMLAAVDEAGLRALAPGITVELGPPVSAMELAAYQEEVPEAIPAALADVWRDVGGGGFTSPHAAIRFLPPHEVLERRTELRGKLRERLDPKRDAAMLLRVEAIDVLAITGDAPLILFDTEQAAGSERCFASPGTAWLGSLGWQIATEINLAFKRELEAALGDIYRLKLGQHPSAGTRRVRLARGDKQWEAILDGVQLLTRTVGGRPAIKHHPDAEAAARAFDEAVAAAQAKGFG